MMPVILVRLRSNLNFLTDIRKVRKYKNLMKMRPLWESSCPMLKDGRTDGRIDMTKLRVTLRNCVNAPKNRREIVDVQM
jgi:hypothetical protein